MKWLKIFLLSSPLFICALGLFGLSGNVSATSITSNINSAAEYSKNFDPTIIRHLVGPTSSPFYAFNEYPVTGLWDYTQGLSFPNPYSAKTGTGFSSSLYFTMHSTTGNFVNLDLPKLMGESLLGFEHLDEQKPYCSQTMRFKILDYSTVQFLLESSCPAGTFPEGTSFDEVEGFVNFHPDSIFWCANDNPSKRCSSNGFGITVYNLDYYFKVLQTPQESHNQTVVDQNQKIIDQNDVMINQLEATNDWLTDDTAPSADSSSLGNAAGWLPPGPLDSILNLPIQFIQGIVGVFTGTHTCQAFTIPVPWVNYNLQIPCMRPLFDQAGWSYIWNGVGTIISAILIFHTFGWLYKFVEKTLSMRENDTEVWGGL